MRRIWTPQLVRRLRSLYPKLGPVETAARLGLSRSAVTTRANRLGISTGRRYWTEADSQTVRDLYPTNTAEEIASALGRTRKAIEQHAKLLGLRKIADLDPLIPAVKDLHARGLTDAAIARELADRLHSDDPRRAITGLRERIGLPVNAASILAVKRQAARTQLERLGLNSHAELRSRSFRRYAVENGWPADIRPRGVQVLNVLAEQGPKTRRELVAALGLKWKSTNKGRNNLASRDPGGSVLAILQARGFVIRQRRYTTGKPHGKNQLPSVYTLTLKAINWREDHVGSQRQDADESVLTDAGS